MKNVLLVDTDILFQGQLSECLSRDFNVLTASSVQETSRIVMSSSLDFIVCDYDLEDGTCLEILNLLKQIDARPKVFVTSDRLDKQMALDLLRSRVDDVLEKPCVGTEVLAHLNQHKKEKSVVATDMRLVPYEKILKFQGHSIALTEVEFKLLAFFLLKEESWISRDDLIRHVWGQSKNSRNTLDTHLTNLKKKVPTFRESLRLVRGRGYQFTPVSAPDL